jgi:hypothetical protein
MEPITFTAIVAALTAGAFVGIGKVGETALVDAYNGLKATLKSRFGDDSEVVRAVDTVEEDPKSDWRQGMLKEMLERAGADQDPEVRKAAEELRKQVERQPGGEQHVMYARGNYIAQADRGSTAEVRVERTEE